MATQLNRLKINIKIAVRKALSFLTKRIETKTFILLASIIVGLFSGLAAVALKSVVHFIQVESKYLTKLFDTSLISFLLPLLGIALSLLIIKLLFKGEFTSGLSNIIYLIVRKQSDIPARKIFSHLFTSGVTVGTGGSVGLEAPIVVIGASLGSNIAKEFKLNYQYRTLLLACGSAAGISAIFNSPIAGVIFAFEVLLPDITISSFISLLISSASSSVLSKLIYSGQPFYLVSEGWEFHAIPYYILLGIICGLMSVYMIKTSFAVEGLLKKLNNKLVRAIVGGLLLCLLIFLFPTLFGEGYSSISLALTGDFSELASATIPESFKSSQLFFIVLITLIALMKVIAMALTIGSGGNGGIIAPSLFTGAFTGLLIALVMKALGVIELNHANFIVVGMGGVLSGVLHAPLTGIFLIAEITGGYALIVPLMIVTSISFFISKIFNKYSIYTRDLALKGIDFRSEKEKFVVQHLSIDSLIETDFQKFQPNMLLRELVEKLPFTKRNLFPIVNAEDQLVGVVTLDDIREVILDKNVYDVILIYEIMNSSFQKIDINADINLAIKLFEEKQIWNIAVTRNNKYVGFISKSNLYNRYISLWHQRQSEEI